MAYGVLMPSIKAHFDCSTVTVATIGSLHLAVMFLFSVLFSLMTQYCILIGEICSLSVFQNNKLEVFHELGTLCKNTQKSMSIPVIRDF